MTGTTAPTAPGLRPARSGPLAAATLALVGAALVVAVDPQHTHVPLCPFHAVAGLQCPLCGSLRAVNALARGQLVRALHDNVVFVLALPVVAALWLMWLTRARSGRGMPSWPRWATVALIAVAVAFTVVRNLPAASALRP